METSVIEFFLREQMSPAEQSGFLENILRAAHVGTGDNDYLFKLLDSLARLGPTD